MSRQRSCLSEVRSALASEQSARGREAVKVLDSSVLGEEWEGLNSVEDGVILFQQGEEHKQAGTEVCERRILGASHSHVLLGPRVSVA